MTKVLLIAHYFPPIGGAGVQRSAKFVKHLPAFGFVPVVLTEEPNSDGHWKPQDLSLLTDIPSDTVIHRVRWNAPVGSSPRTKSFNEARISALIESGLELIRIHRPQLILVTMSPFEDARVAATLSARTKLPWVADLRDPWALDEVQIYRTYWHRWLECRRMRVALASASSIIMNTPEAARQFRRAFPEIAARARVSITNGYDSEDFQLVPARPSRDRFTIVHSGYLHTQSGLHQRSHPWMYRCLGRIKSGVEILPRSHYYLMQALEQWQDEEPQIRNNVRLMLVGVHTPTDQAVTRNSSAADLVEFTGYQPHSDSVRQVEASDVLFLPMHHVPLDQRATIVPGKTYEYMASQRPIIAAVPEGDARDFLSTCGTARLCYPKDVTSLLKALKSAYHDWKSGANSSLRWNREAVERFERRCLTGALAEELAVVRDHVAFRN